MRVHDDVIQGITFRRLLECDAINDRAGKAPRLRADQHGQQIGGAHLALKMASGRSARCWARRLTHELLSIARFV